MSVGKAAGAVYLEGHSVMHHGSGAAEADRNAGHLSLAERSLAERCLDVMAQAEAGCTQLQSELATMLERTVYFVPEVQVLHDSGKVKILHDSTKWHQEMDKWVYRDYQEISKAIPIGENLPKAIVDSFQRLGKLKEVNAFAASITNQQIKKIILSELLERTIALYEAGKPQKAIEILESIDRSFIHCSAEHLPVNKLDVLITLVDELDKDSCVSIKEGLYLKKYNALENLGDRQGMEKVIIIMKGLSKMPGSFDLNQILNSWTFGLFEKYLDENDIDAALRVALLFEVSEGEVMSQTFLLLSRKQEYLNEDNIVKAILVALAGTLKFSNKGTYSKLYWDGILDLIYGGRFSEEAVELVREIIWAFPRALNEKSGNQIEALKDEFNDCKDKWIKKQEAAGAGEPEAQREIINQEQRQALIAFALNG